MRTRIKWIFTIFFGFMLQFVVAQEKTIKGIVSTEKGGPLAGANIVVKGTTRGSSTDFDGSFSIKAKVGDVLIFTFVGMDQLTRTVDASGIVNMKMRSSESGSLETVVVTGFGIKRNSRDLGYTVSKVKAADLTENTEPDLLRSLSGKVAGVNVNFSTGVAGAANQILIRGVSSLTGKTQPLFVVDGVTYSNEEVETSSQTSGGGGYESGISNLDPNSIASVSVLKSSAAAALYGSRAMNGVIVITTKSGSTNKPNQKLSVSIGSGTYFETIANLPDYQNKYGAGSQFNYANSNGSWGPSFETKDSRGIDKGKIPTWQPLKDAFPSQFGDFVDYKAQPDNVKKLFRQGLVRDNTISLNYAGKEGSFSTTFSKLNQDGYIPFNTFDKNSVTIGGNFKLANNLTAGANMSYTDSKQVGAFFGENQVAGAASSFARTLFVARNWDLSLPYENPDYRLGSVVPNVGGQFDHPLWSLEHNQIKTGTNRTVLGINLNYEFNKNISASYRVGYNRYNLSRDEIIDVGSRAAATLGSLRREIYSVEDLESTFLLNFDYKLTNDIGFKTILGNNVIQNKFSDFNILGEQFINRGIFTFENVKKTTTIGQEYSQGSTKRNVGFFADATISLKNFLFLNATVRKELSSSLRNDRNSYIYPSVSASFIITDALKMKSTILNFAKIRVGYAKVGRDPDAEFTKQFIQSGSLFNTNTTAGLQREVADPLIKPEFSNEKEIGADLELFNSRIIVDFSLYNKQITDLITRIPAVGSSGADFLKTNVGSMENKGVEIGLTIVPVRTKNFKWTLFTNFTQNRNKVLNLKEGVERINNRTNTISYAIPGETYGVFYGTKFARDNQGNFLIDPLRGGVIATLEPGIVGNPEAKFKMSFINTISYKGFSLKTQFDWKKGGDVYSTTIQSLLGRGVTKDTEDRERLNIIPGFYGNVADGTVLLDSSGNKIPNTTQITTNDLYFSPAGTNTFGINSVNEASVFDGTIYRLREASLTYDLPSKFLDKTPFGKVSFSVLGTNLWYFAPNVPKYTNFDPDTTSYGGSRIQGIEVNAAPTSRRYGFKVNITF